MMPLERADAGFQLNSGETKGEDTSVNAALVKPWQKTTVIADAGG